MNKFISSVEIETIREDGTKHVYLQSGSAPKEGVGVEIADVSPTGERTVKVAKPMDSYVGNMVRILEGGFENATFNVPDTSNTSRNFGGMTDGITRMLPASALVNDSTYGVVVGSGTNAVAITDYKLQTQIVEGTGAGQLTHQVVQWNTYATAGSTTSFVLKRRFTNGSGGDITINEIGIYVKTGHFPFFKFCIFRDVLGVSPYTVHNGETCEVQITVPITLGSGYVGALAKLFFQTMTNDTTTLLDTGNTSRTLALNYSQFEMTDPANSAVNGVVVGTGNTAVTINDHALQTQIAHGSGAGQLVHGAVQFDGIVTTGLTAYVDAKRTFTNSSGGSITINEIAVYARNRITPSNTDDPFCILRIVLNIPQTVLNGSPVQVKVNMGVSL
jgi:hypothetical protein